MRLSLESFTVHKRFPLTISRGTTSHTTNIWVRLDHQGIEGWGEASPFAIATPSHPLTKTPQTTQMLLNALELVIPTLETYTPWERQKIERVLLNADVPSAARAAIDIALQDWLGKQLGVPLWKLWGCNRHRIVPISATIGIGTPEAVTQRVRDWIPITGGNVLKLKLGSPEGIEADREMLLAIRNVAPQAQLTVDANGGWRVDDAIKMCDWLAQQGVKYVEQPLPAGQEADLPLLYSRSPLPIFVDESCFISADIPPLADCVHGINIKLMKSGGLTEALRMVHTAKACGLQVMYGCYSDSTLANTAASHLSSFADYLDLDSHLNLADDPFTGATLQDGRLIPNNLSGLGVQRHVSDQ